MYQTTMWFHGWPRRRLAAHTRTRRWRSMRHAADYGRKYGAVNTLGTIQLSPARGLGEFQKHRLCRRRGHRQRSWKIG